MHITTGQVIGTALATGVVGFFVWFATVPLRRRSVTGLIASVVLMGPLAVLGGIGWALLLGPQVNGPEAALQLAVVAVVVAAVEGGVGAARALRRFARSQHALRVSVGLVGGTTPDDAQGAPLLSELEAVRTDLTQLGRDLQVTRARDHALDESRRRLIAWVSQDLHAPLTVLRAMSDPLDGVDVPGAPLGVRVELERLVAVVDDLFDLATASPDHAARSLVVPRWEPARLADVLGDAVAALEPLIRLRGVGVNVRGDTAVQVRLLGASGDDLGRRLITALVDAVRRSRPGTTVTVEVSLLADDDDVRIDIHPGDLEPLAERADLRSTNGVRLPVVVPV